VSAGGDLKEERRWKAFAPRASSTVELPRAYSRIGVFSFLSKRKGRLFNEFLEEGGPLEVDFDWFTDEARVVEII